MKVVGSSDHGVTHSLYIEDPDGNEVERLTGVPPMAQLQRLIERGAKAAESSP